MVEAHLEAFNLTFTEKMGSTSWAILHTSAWTSASELDGLEWLTSSTGRGGCSQGKKYGWFEEAWCCPSTAKSGPLQKCLWGIGVKSSLYSLPWIHWKYTSWKLQQSTMTKVDGVHHFRPSTYCTKCMKNWRGWCSRLGLQGHSVFYAPLQPSEELQVRCSRISVSGFEWCPVVAGTLIMQRGVLWWFMVISYRSECFFNRKSMNVPMMSCCFKVCLRCFWNPKQFFLSCCRIPSVCSRSLPRTWPQIVRVLVFASRNKGNLKLMGDWCMNVVSSFSIFFWCSYLNSKCFWKFRNMLLLPWTFRKRQNRTSTRLRLGCLLVVFTCYKPRESIPTGGSTKGRSFPPWASPLRQHGKSRGGCHASGHHVFSLARGSKEAKYKVWGSSILKSAS